MFALMILLVVFLALAATIGTGVMILRAARSKARESGYASVGDYLRATPRTDQEKRDAVDLALRGLVLCLVGLLFPPLLLVGPVPLYYGARKLAFVSMGFGLFEDAEPPSA